ncbi:PQQ-dependent sugar dehydrogenase [Veronia pacifica]|uniref:Glucose dehydrogenase n=1 Tax=Veronia pacifica TaxID=1080227 RepID=A0A1C3EIC1_9GAMM|nr:PQQ-dependent sugar dehydrogenase [Veronia pacifica]ODA32984.1 glucose dehydrogenase [Veronia pacifica]
MNILRSLPLIVSAYLFPFSTTADTINTDEHTINITTVASGLDHPWSLVFLPGGNMLVTERNGGLKRISPSGDTADIDISLPGLKARGQGGILGLAIAPDYPTSKQIYIAYSQHEKNKSGTSVAKATLNENTLTDTQVIFAMAPKVAGTRHYGSRLLIKDGYLYISLGDRGQRDRAQKLSDHLGTMIKLNLDGSVPNDNPFYSKQDAKSDIYSFGHRNIQGLTLSNDGTTIWAHEHGPQGGDELNVVSSGLNYGWPEITYGVNYVTGSKIGVGTKKDGLVQPIHYWVPSIAPSGLTMVKGKVFEHWHGDLLLGSLKFGQLVRLKLSEEKVIHEERMLDGKYGRIRDVAEGPDGAIYLLTDANNGKILRLSPIQTSNKGS